MAGHVTLGELVRRARHDGVAGVARRAAFELYHRTGASALEATIAEADLVDPGAVRLPPLTARIPPTGDATIGWVCTAPGPGSGGHTTLFRMVAAMRSRGYRCVLFLYDSRGGDLRRHRNVIRDWWPWLDADVRDASAGITGVQAAVASSWETAHVLARYGREPMARLYFVQDFEPLFYPRGALAAFAEDSYRLGFHTIALGDMVHELLAGIGVDAELAPFGRDAGVYALRNTGARTGVAFYAKRGSDRRGLQLGRLALAAFHRLHPEQQIHVYGDDVSDWPFPVIAHGRLTPVELDELYNGVLGGLALSFTNISLVAEEMLASGAIPVINDDRLARADLTHPEAVWARPSYGALAAALAGVVEEPDVPGRAVRASRLARPGWDAAQDVVAGAIAEELGRPRGRLLAGQQLAGRLSPGRSGRNGTGPSRAEPSGGVWP